LFQTDNIPCDEDWIDFIYLKANRININFRRDKEWKFSLPLDELASLEQELYFDPHLTFQEKMFYSNKTRALINRNLSANIALKNSKK
jgi:hypothetical protein